MTAEDLLQDLANWGCPYYISNDGARSRQGYPCCTYCDEVIERGGTHADDCLWLEVMKYETA